MSLYKCLFERISNDQAKEIYNELIDRIKNNSINSTIVQTENFIFQISDSEDQNNNNLNISTINLGECGSILKNNTNSSLILLKVDSRNEDLTSTYVFFEIFNSKDINNKIDLNLCKNIPIEIRVPKKLDNTTLIYYSSLNESGYNLFNPEDSFFNDICSTYTSKDGKDMLLSDRWKDIYSTSNDKYYCQKECKLISYDLMSEKAICNCNIPEEKDRNIDTELDNIDFSFVSKGVIGRFSKPLKNSNFFILKCYKLIFEIKIFLKNIGSIFISIIILIYIILMIIYFFTGKKKIMKFTQYILELKNKGKMSIKNKGKINIKNKGKINIKESGKRKIISLLKRKKNKVKKPIGKNNPPKKESNQTNNIINIKNSYSIYTSDLSRHLYLNNLNNNLNRNSSVLKLKNNSTKKILLKQSKTYINKKKGKNNFTNNKHLIISDYELNNLDYENAIKLDKRTFLQYYISLIRRKQIILFAFIPNNDFNLTTIKLSLFLISFTSYFAINGFFFNDETMHQIYKASSKYNIIDQISIIIYSSLITSTLNVILRELSLSEKSFISIKKENNYKKFIIQAKDVRNYLIIKCIIFYIIGLVLLIFYWFFISCFCAVYVNTQIILLKDTLISFSLSMTYPFGINLFPGMLRIPSLRINIKNIKKNNKKCLYNVSKFIALI